MMRTFFLGFFVLFLTSCGFQLRGSIDYGVVEAVYVQSDSADAFANHMKQQLNSQPNIALAKTIKKADVVILLSDLKVDRRVLTISANTGRLEEIELSLQVYVEMRQPDDTVLLEQQKLGYIRDYSFNERAVLAMGAEEEMLRKELLQEATLQVLRMLQIVSHQVKAETKLNPETETK